MITGYLVEHNLEGCHYLDSDVMLYADVNNVEFYKHSFSTIGNTFGEGFFSTEILKKFCSFLVERYNKSEVLEDLKQEYFAKRNVGVLTAISDMSFAELYIKENGGEYRDLRQVEGGKAFIDNMRATAVNPFRPLGKNIEIVLYRGRPYGFHIEKGTWVQLHCLHCQGPDLKPLMKLFWEAPICKDPEKVLCLDENWNWHEQYLLEVLGNTLAKLAELRDKEEIDPLEYYALLQGHNKMLDSLC